MNTPRSALKKKTSTLNVEVDEVIGDHDHSSSSSADATATASNSNNNPSPVYAFGFFSCMVLMELTLEGTNAAFPDLLALPYAVTLFQFGCCFALPILISRGKSLESFPKTGRACIPYISLSLVVFGSTFLASLSVRYVSYPTKVVFKSAKLIPTMIVATFLQPGKKFSVFDYLSATLLCAGAAGYGFGSGTPPGKNGDAASSYMGMSVLLVSIFCDAFTPNLQQRLMAPPTTPGLPTSTPINGIKQRTNRFLSSLFLPPGGGLGLSAQELMTNANGVGCVGLVTFMAVTGSLFEALGTALEHPVLFLYLSVIGLSLSTAVFCYTRLIQESGSVVAVAVATLRKVATVILSYIVYPKAISMLHIASAFLVLGGILLSNYSKQRSATK